MTVNAHYLCGSWASRYIWSRLGVSSSVAVHGRVNCFPIIRRHTNHPDYSYSTYGIRLHGVARERLIVGRISRGNCVGRISGGIVTRGNLLGKNARTPWFRTRTEPELLINPNRTRALFVEQVTRTRTEPNLTVSITQTEPNSSSEGSFSSLVKTCQWY